MRADRDNYDIMSVGWNRAGVPAPSPEMGHRWASGKEEGDAVFPEAHRGDISMPNTQRIDWLQSLGLDFDPFEHLDAGQDPHLSDYLIKHGSFDRMTAKEPVILLAPAGGGKTAFRVRLAAACRAEEGGRRIFPLTFLFPAPESLEMPLDEGRYFEILGRSAAQELLLHLAHRAYRFSRLEPSLQQSLKGVLQEKLPLEYYLEQVENTGSLDPLIDAFDPTARRLPNPPLPETLRAFCRTLRGLVPLPGKSGSAQERFHTLVELLLRRLGFEAIFILVDGADAYDARPEKVLSLLEPMLRRTAEWTEEAVFVKYFLPVKLDPLIPKRITPLTNICSVVKIKWTREELVQVLRERLRVASGNLFDSFRAIGTPDLPREAEAVLAEHVIPILPREAIYLGSRIWSEHLARVGPHGRISRADLDGAIEQYREEKGNNGEPA